MEFYRLNSSGVTNLNYIAKLQEHGAELISKYRNATDIDIIIGIQEAAEDDSVYDGLMFTLTMASNLVVPLRYSDVRLYYFMLQLNRAYFEGKTKIKATTLRQALTFYELCDGQFQDLALEQQEGSQIRFTKFNVSHRGLLQGYQVQWQIPINFYKDKNTNKTVVAIAGQGNPYAMLSIPDLEIKDHIIPKALFMKFFGVTPNTRVEMNSTDDLRLAFDATDEEAFLEVLDFIGLSLRYKINTVSDTDYIYDHDMKLLKAELLNNTASFANLESQEDIVLWQQFNYNTYLFLRPGARYLPLRRSNIIEIYMRG